MISLTQQNSIDLRQLLDDINNAGDEASLRLQMVNRIHKIFASSSTIFWRINEENRLVDPVFKGIQDQYLMPYKDYFYRQNPFDPGNLAVLPRPSILMEQLLPLHTFHRTEYYNDFIKPQNIKRQMAIYIHHGGMLKAVIGMHRTSTCNFDPNCQFMGDMISQWTSAAFDRLQLREQLAREKSIRRIFEAKTANGILLFDRTNKCVYANTAAEKMCRRIGIDHPVSNQFHQPFPIPKFLTEGVEKAQKGLSTNRIQQTLFSGKQQFEVKWKNVDSILPDSSVMVSLSETDAVPAIRRSNLKQTFHLTPREIEIISHICRGLSNAQIADTLFISEGTVKNHLKHIFAKMRVSNRTQVVHKALFENHHENRDH